MEILNKSHFYNNNFIVFGHRGVPEELPENTIESFEKAIALNYSGIELDVLKTADNKLIVHHDKAVDINNQHQEIKKIKYSQLLKNNPSIPTLEQVLDVVGHRTNVNIEIKNQGVESFEVVKNTIEMLKKLNLIENIVISSFSSQLIKESKKIDDRFVTAWILGPKNIRFYSYWKTLLKQIKVNALHVHHKNISAQLVRKIHSYKIKILSYTVNSETILKSLVSKKIDGIFTDSPKILDASRRLIP